MIFHLTSFEYLVADKWMKCDALQIWIDLKLTYPISQKGLYTWFSARNGIEQGVTYLHYEFVDEETGEILTMNCRLDMNKLMVQNNLYPPIIQQAFKNYKA